MDFGRLFLSSTLNSEVLGIIKSGLDLMSSDLEEACTLYTAQKSSERDLICNFRTEVEIFERIIDSLAQIPKQFSETLCGVASQFKSFFVLI